MGSRLPWRSPAVLLFVLEGWIAGLTMPGIGRGTRCGVEAEGNDLRGEEFRNRVAGWKKRTCGLRVRVDRSNSRAGHSNARDSGSKARDGGSNVRDGDSNVRDKYSKLRD